MQMKSSAQEKKDHRHLGLLSRPVVRVVSVWLWVVVGPLLVALLALLAFHTDLVTARHLFGAHPYLASYIEILSAGLLPLVFTVICRDDLSLYGLRGKGVVKSLVFSLLVVVVFYAYALLSTGQLLNVASPSVHLSFPWKIWYAVVGVFAYGPLEVFFVIWLIANTDRMCKSENATVSWGVIVTPLLFGLLHLLTTQSVNTALAVALTFFLLGLIYKDTHNTLGPMLAWTVINGQVWFLAQLLWS